MGDDVRRVADYFVIAGLPEKEKMQLLDEYSLEVNLKPSAYQDPITDVTVIFPSLGENLPDYYQLVEATPTGLSANLNHGSFRAPEVFLCFRRGRDRPPLVDLGVLYDGKDRVLPDSQVVEFTPNGYSANVNNTTNSSTFLTYRRATDMSPCNELVVMDVCVIVASKGEEPPHSFKRIDKTLNKGMVGSDVYICYKKSMNRADLISYRPSLLSRFPLKNNPAYSLEETVALFCLPMGANLECWPANSARSSSVKSTFVLTLANRSKVYGSAITFYEEYICDESMLTQEQKDGLQLHKYRRPQDRKIFTNKCICILSQWPFFEAFESFLFFLHKRQLMGPHDVPLERFISHFLFDVPFPSPSRPRILLQLSGEENIALFQPEELPLPRSGASFIQLLTNLGPDNCLLVLLLCLTEQKILIHSLRAAVLTSVAEAVMQIIFPFYWQCPYIPLCPIGMSDYLAAPLPFIMGLDSRFFDLYDQPTDVNAVDLDTSTVTVCEEKKGLTTKLLPKKAARNLKNQLLHLQEKCWQHEQLAHKLQAQNDGAIDFDFKMKKKEMQLDLEIREVFLHFMVSVLAGYRLFLLPITKAPTVGATDVDNLFDQHHFLRSRDKNFHKFYGMLMKTQMFTKFIEERSFVSETNTYLAFFDECVDRMEHEEMPKFLEVEGFDSDRTVFILPPEATPEDKKEGYKTEKFDLQIDLFPELPEKQDKGEAGTESVDHESEKPIFATPAAPSSLAKRTKQEMRSAQKMARQNQRIPYLWAKCLINTSYSLWFIHLPGYMLANETHPHSLRIGVTNLKRMQRLRLHPADEICYRVMMQLCGVYNQPVLAVKVLFEMKNIGLHPNAVTYGYYNKAVLESEWPSGESNPSQVKWNKIRNVLVAITLFKEAGKNWKLRASRAKSVSSNAVNVLATPTTSHRKANQEDMDVVSQTSSEVSNVEPLKPSATSTAEKTEVLVKTEAEKTLEKQADVKVKENGDSEHAVETTDKMVDKTEESINKEDKDDLDDQSKTSDGASKKEFQFRRRVRSIVKPHGTGGLAEKEESEDQGLTDPNGLNNPETIEEEFLPTDGQDNKVATTSPIENEAKRRLSFTSPTSENVGGHKSIQFEHNPDDLGVSCLQDLKMDSLGADKKMLEKQSDQDSKPKLILNERDELETSGSVPTARHTGKYSEIRGRFSKLLNSKSIDQTDDGKKVNRSLFRSESADSTNLEQQVRDYMEPPRGTSEPRSISEDPSQSPSVDSLDQLDSLPNSPTKRHDGKLPPLHENNFLSLQENPLHKVASTSSIRSVLVGTPVTENDPLGALSNQPSPVNSIPKSATCPSGDLGHLTASTSNLRVNENILGTPFEDKSRSQTLPNDTTDGSRGSNASISTSFSSFKNLTGTKLSSLKKGSSYLSNYLSPNAATSKKTQDALYSIKSAYANAATVVSKRVEEIRESGLVATTPGLSPAPSSQYLSTPDGGRKEEDAVSNSSGDVSRRPSAVDGGFYVNDQSETWSAFTGALWDQFWGTDGSAYKGNAQNRPPPRVADISEQYERLYSELPKRPPGPVAMELQMTSCSICRYCKGILFDENIMAGWTAEDSNLNTKCPFCDRMVVPFLTIRVIDFRTRPKNYIEQEEKEVKENGNVPDDGQKDAKRIPPPPVISDHITVPYLSPLVLRKELENMLETEGDTVLLDPQGVDSHPIIFWNLVWFFERIAVKSHLPGFCLTAKSLNASEPTCLDQSWQEADHRNIYIQCRWDNERLHETGEPPLYTLWQKHQSETIEAKQLVVMVEKQNPEYRDLMQQIINAVQVNDLVQPMKTMLERREAKTSSTEPGTPTKPPLSPMSESPGTPRTPRSIYREILFLTLVSLGQDNIDLTAFDREYRRAFEKLPSKYDALVHKCDRPPSPTTNICRKLFRELKL